MKAIFYVFGCPINDDTICYFLFYEITEEKATLNSHCNKKTKGVCRALISRAKDALLKKLMLNNIR